METTPQTEVDDPYGERDHWQDGPGPHRGTNHVKGGVVCLECGL